MISHNIVTATITLAFLYIGYHILLYYLVSSNFKVRGKKEKEK